MFLKKKIGVTLRPELHAQVKSAAPLRGLNLEQAYEQALSRWLADNAARSSGESPGTDKASGGIAHGDKGVNTGVTVIQADPWLNAIFKDLLLVRTHQASAEALEKIIHAFGGLIAETADAFDDAELPADFAEAAKELRADAEIRGERTAGAGKRAAKRRAS